MPNVVQVTITGKILGYTLVVPFSQDLGPQFYTPGGSTADDAVLYKVPYYEVSIQGGDKYAAVRFGLQNKGRLPPPNSRMCDAGLSAMHLCTPTWIPTYSPHSFTGTARAGAWRLLPGKSFLIHEGADARAGQVGGSLGCVEILNGQWDYFLDQMEYLGAAECAMLGSRQKLKVKVEPAAFPMATLMARR